MHAHVNPQLDGERGHILPLVVGEILEVPKLGVKAAGVAHSKCVASFVFLPWREPDVHGEVMRDEVMCDFHEGYSTRPALGL